MRKVPGVSLQYRTALPMAAYKLPVVEAHIGGSTTNQEVVRRVFKVTGWICNHGQAELLKGFSEGRLTELYEDWSRKKIKDGYVVSPLNEIKRFIKWVYTPDEY